MGIVFDIQRFCTRDGPGIRTTVFLKGCPLNCLWCHNPESKSRRPQLFYSSDLCIGCGRCVDACPAKAHSIVLGTHSFDRSGCVLCMRCAEVCPSLALETTGREMTAEQVIAEVLKDEVFYEESGGGMTLSGGEPMAQFEFTRDLLHRARGAGIHTCIETSGAGAPDCYVEIAPLVDLFLWDIKDTDQQRHKSNVGIDRESILHNLAQIDALGRPTQLRCIVLNGVNLEQPHLDELMSIRDRLKHCQGIELLAYHSLGDSKHARLGMRSMSDSRWTPTDEQMEWARAYISGSCR